MTAHAVNSPSGAERWVQCPGSNKLALGIADRSSSFAEEGTAAHELAAMCLDTNTNAAEHVGMVSVDAPGWAFTEEMADNVMVYVNDVRARSANAVGVYIEQRVSMEDYVPGCWGTSDAIVLRADEIETIDLKYGRGVRVDATENKQLMLYALGAWHAYGAALDIQRVRMTIIQPRLNHISEWTCSVDDLLEFAKAAGTAAEISTACLEGKADPLQYLSPSEDACRFCRAKAKCPAMQMEVASVVFGDAKAVFGNLTQADIEPPSADTLATLPEQMALVGLVEDWCKAVRAAVESALLSGAEVAGYKLVQGRQGPRRWTSAEAAEDMLRKTFRVKVEDAYDLKVISPTSAEKLLKKGLLGDRQWAKLEALITRDEGGLSVAPATDKRPGVTPQPIKAADAFEDVSTADLV